MSLKNDLESSSNMSENLGEEERENCKHLNLFKPFDL